MEGERSGGGGERERRAASWRERGERRWGKREG
jgi:hypothetical protein